MVEDQGTPETGQGFCSGCGEGISQDALYCPYCGQRAADNPGFCSHCGGSINAGVRFCPDCGAEAVVGTAQPPCPSAIAGPEVEYMGFWVRFAAWVIDAVITGIIGSIVSAIVGVPAVGSLLSILYYVLFTGLKGQTPGKMALRIKVVDAQGNVPGLGRAMLREIVGKFVSAIVILLGYVWVGWDRRKRGWHDHISGTYVMRAPRR